ncbi:hypothetical protein NQ315_005392 [Exocentrus adspersus]|uniref:Protein downstream neighbor of son homolog n=1 Tax=Exocentrus adspersus TaxID=1586481 RepID=A0AAV8W238_9CUCU|nr:hypothetical protein NQ315_005392 [Exocentrus adspersus]
MLESSEEKMAPKWYHPTEVMKLHKLKQKKKALQARISGGKLQNRTVNTTEHSSYKEVFLAKKRKNPFLKESDCKKNRIDDVLSESSDQTLFKLFNQNVSASPTTASFTSFNNILSKLEPEGKTEIVEVVKAKGESWLPIDWTLKRKVRLLSTKPFPWNQKLKVSEEASGITAFTRCLSNSSETTLDTSPNAKFYQCCLYWQQPCLPWLNLFPRTNMRTSLTGPSVALNCTVKESLHSTWTDSLRSVYQLIRTRQCPYFYICANNFTALFRAAGICGFSDIHVLITPTTRGFRQMLKQDDIEFTMPLKKGRVSDLDTTVGKLDLGDCNEMAEEATDDHWLKNMGIGAEDIKQINYTQEKITHRAECEIDSSEQSLILVEGAEVHALYNFLLNCKSATALTGPLAGIPPTLLAPVAFHGASLNSLKVRDNKVNLEGVDYYSLELSGPILPTTTHNLFAINPPEHSITMTFSDVANTEPFSKVLNKRNSDIESKGSIVFGKENLSDSGMLPKILKHFCAADDRYVTNVECLKYTSDNKTYTWS